MTEIVLSEKYSKQARNLLAGLFIIAFTYVLDFARDFLLPVVLAFLIALTFRPSIRSLARHGVPPWLTATVFMLAVIFAGLAFVYLMIAPIQQWIDDAPYHAQTFADKARGMRGVFERFIHMTEQLQEAATPDAAGAPREVVVMESPIYGYFSQVTGYSASVITTVVLALVTAVFLMASGDLFYAKLVRVLPRMNEKKTALRIVYDVEREVSSYLLIVTAINAGLGIVVAASFHALGMPSPVLWALVVFLLNFVPYVGPVFGGILSAFMAIVTFDSLGYAMLVPLAYVFWNGIENQFVTPLLLGRRLQLNSVSILIALAFWTWIWGIAGTIIAVPVLVTIKVFSDHLEGLSALGEFLSEKYPDDNPAPAREAAPAEVKPKPAEPAIEPVPVVLPASQQPGYGDSLLHPQTASV